MNMDVILFVAFVVGAVVVYRAIRAGAVERWAAEFKKRAEAKKRLP